MTKNIPTFAQMQTIRNVAEIIRNDAYLQLNITESARNKTCDVVIHGHLTDTQRVDGAIHIRFNNYEIFAFTPDVIHVFNSTLYYCYTQSNIDEMKLKRSESQ